MEGSLDCCFRASNSDPGNGPAAALDEKHKFRRGPGAQCRLAWKAKAEPTTDTAVALRDSRGWARFSGRGAPCAKRNVPDQATPSIRAPCRVSVRICSRQTSSSPRKRQTCTTGSLALWSPFLTSVWPRGRRRTRAHTGRVEGRDQGAARPPGLHGLSLVRSRQAFAAPFLEDKCPCLRPGRHARPFCRYPCREQANPARPRPLGRV